MSDEMHTLVSLVFHQCLFSKDGDLKSISSESRGLAFQLIKSLCKNNNRNLNTLLKQCLEPLSAKIPVKTAWNHVPGSDCRSPAGYVGIKNLGCICYMNSMLQQFFMVKPLRNGLLIANDAQQPNMVIREKENHELDDNMFHQLQIMFAQLLLSDRMDYNPSDFCYSFKNYTGMPVDLNVQQDAQEFLNILFDQIESSIKNTPFRKLLQGVYGGSTVTQLTCPKCKNIREKKENFFNISLTIKNLKKLQECFDKFILGEVISDYLCEGCNQKVDLTKRQLINELPNVLILHLQRIVFDLDLLQNEKINTRLEFPLDLDLNDYLLDKDVSSKYNLVGVVVHIGAAEFGHYFSYIDVGNNQWIEFNDSKVKVFDVSNLENQCFGGPSNGSGDNDMWGWYKSDKDNSQNAYMLIYEKIQKDQLTLHFESEEKMHTFTTQFNIKIVSHHQIAVDNIEAKVDYNSIPEFVSPQIQQIIQSQNNYFQLELNLCNTEFFEFLADISGILQLNESNQNNNHSEQCQIAKQLIITLIPYAFDLMARAYENRHLDTVVSNMKAILTVYPEVGFELLEKLFLQRGTQTIDTLLICPESHTRVLMSQLIAHTLNAAINQTIKNDISNIYDANSPIGRSLAVLLSLLYEQVPQNWLRMSQYFSVFGQLLQLNPQSFNAWARQHKILALMLDFMMEGSSPLKLIDSNKKFNMGNSNVQPNFTTLLDVSVQLIKLGDIGQDVKLLLYSSRLIDKLLRFNKKSITGVSQLIFDMSLDNQLYSEIVSSCVLKHLYNIGQDSIQSILELIMQFIALEDDIQQLRIEWILGYPQNEQKGLLKGTGVIPQFGIYGMNGLEEDIYKFPSPLHYQTSLLDLILSNIGNYKRNENIGIACIASLISACNKNKKLRDYIISLPSPQLICPRFYHFLDLFVEGYVKETKRYYYQTFPREEIQQQAQQAFILFKSNISEEEEQNNPNYIIGRTISEDQPHQTKCYLYAIDKKDKIEIDKKQIGFLVSEDQDPDYYHIIYNNNQFEKICIIYERTYITATCKSKPNMKGNDSIPNSLCKGTQFLNNNVQKGTQAEQFIEYKHNKYGNNNINHIPYNYNTHHVVQLSSPSTNSLESIVPSIIQDDILLLSDEQMNIDEYQESDCVKTISITNLKQKQVHFILGISGDDNLRLPYSKIQKIVKSNSYVIFTTLQKMNRQKEWKQLEMTLDYNILEGFGDTLFVTPISQQDKKLFNYR